MYYSALTNEKKSPISYPGGKGKIAKELLPYIPPFEEYREPFFGGGSVYFAVRQRLKRTKQFWVNDACPFVSAFWRQIRDNPQELFRRLEQQYMELHYNNPQYTRDPNLSHEKKEEHKQFVKKFFNTLKEQSYKELSELETALNFYWINRMTFSSVQSAGFAYIRFQRCNPKQYSRIPKLSPLLQNTHITTGDYSKLLEKKGKHVFLYLDPPYENNQNSSLYGRNGDLHTLFDHKKLATLLKKCNETREHKFLLTYNDSEIIRNYYDWADIKKINLQYDMTDASERVDELLISNFGFEKDLYWNIEQTTLNHFY